MGLIYFVAGMLLALAVLSVPFWNETVRAWVLKQSWTMNFVSLWMQIWFTRKRDDRRRHVDEFFSRLLASRDFHNNYWHSLDYREKQLVRLELQDRLEKHGFFGANDLWKACANVRSIGLRGCITVETRRSLFEKTCATEEWRSETLDLVNFCYGGVRELPIELLSQIVQRSLHDHNHYIDEWANELSDEQGLAIANMDIVKNKWSTLDTLYGTKTVPQDQARLCFESMIQHMSPDPDELMNCCTALREWPAMLRVISHPCMADQDLSDLVTEMHAHEARKVGVDEKVIEEIGLKLAETGQLDLLDWFYWTNEQELEAQKIKAPIRRLEFDATTRHSCISQDVLRRCYEKNMQLARSTDRNEERETALQAAAKCLVAMQDWDEVRRQFPAFESNLETYGYIRLTMNKVDNIPNYVTS